MQIFRFASSLCCKISLYLFRTRALDYRAHYRERALSQPIFLYKYSCLFLVVAVSLRKNKNAVTNMTGLFPAKRALYYGALLRKRAL